MSRSRSLFKSFFVFNLKGEPLGLVLGFDGTVYWLMLLFLRFSCFCYKIIKDFRFDDSAWASWVSRPREELLWVFYRILGVVVSRGFFSTLDCSSSRINSLMLFPDCNWDCWRGWIVPSLPGLHSNFFMLIIAFYLISITEAWPSDPSLFPISGVSFLDLVFPTTTLLISWSLMLSVSSYWYKTSLLCEPYFPLFLLFARSRFYLSRLQYVFLAIRNSGFSVFSADGEMDRLTSWYGGRCWGRSII